MSDPTTPDAPDTTPPTADQVKLALRKVKDPELNLNIIPAAEYGSRRVSQGDRIEIVQFVGGG